MEEWHGTEKRISGRRAGTEKWRNGEMEEWRGTEKWINGRMAWNRETEVKWKKGAEQRNG